MGNGLNAIGGQIARFAKADDDTRNPAFSKRNENAVARLQIVLEIVGNAVGKCIEGRAQRNDVCKGIRHKNKLSADRRARRHFVEFFDFDKSAGNGHAKATIRWTGKFERLVL